MTNQSRSDNSDLSPSLQGKLQAFAGGLTAEETEQLRGLQTQDVTDMLSLSLREKAQRAVEALTAEEQGELQRLFDHFGAGAAIGGQADAAGFMKPLYDDGLGNKGRPRPSEGSGGGGDLIGLASQKYKEHRDLVLTLASILKNPPFSSPF